MLWKGKLAQLSVNSALRDKYSERNAERTAMRILDTLGGRVCEEGSKNIPLAPFEGGLKNELWLALRLL